MPVALKNFLSLLESGKLKFITSQDFFSYSGNKKKIIRAATISGRLTTLLGYSFTDIDIIQGFGYLICELFARYYQKKVSKYSSFLEYFTNLPTYLIIYLFIIIIIFIKFYFPFTFTFSLHLFHAGNRKCMHEQVYQDKATNMEAPCNLG